MTTITKEAVLAALSTVQEPELHEDLVTLRMIHNLEIDKDVVSFTIMLTTPACPLKGKIESDARKAVLTIPEVSSVVISMDATVPGDGKSRGLVNTPIRNAIAVASGKGGVGKSTIAVNLAVALAQSGAKVGLMDADIYGPNVPIMMGVEKMPAPVDEKLIPAETYGVKMMSMGFLVPAGQPLIWRGPMLNSAIRQFLSDVEWGELDYLIIDLPPGTGDAPLSLAQALPLSGAVIVTIPQAVSLEDASRGLEMFQKLEVPILGVIENMRGDLFGAGGGEALAEKYKIPFFGAVPMQAEVRIGGDSGKPVVVSQPETPAAQALLEIAQNVAARVSVVALNQEAAPSIDIIG